MAQIKGNIFKIETFGAVDGPGIRLVIFLQGCLFRCKYCHNPEGWAFKTQKIKKISIDEIISLFQKNYCFYKNGGITLSGGDPMCQPEFVLALAKKCRQKKINLAIDTSACNFFTHPKIYKQLLSYVDLWLVDIKALDKKMHLYLTNYENLTGLNFCNYLEKNKKPFLVRYVLIKKINDGKKQLINLAKFLAKFKYIKSYQIISYHNLAIDKYRNLNINYCFKNVELMSNIEYTKIKTFITKQVEKYKYKND